MNRLGKPKIINDEENSLKNQSFLIACILTTFSLLLAIMIGFSPNSKGIYKLLFMIPLVYGCLNFIFFRVYDRKSFPKVTILLLMFIRYFIGPLFIYFDRFPSSLYNLVYSQDTIILATFLMCIEVSCLFGALWIFEKKRENPAIGKREYDFLSGKNFGKINLLLTALIIITAAMYLVYPALFHNYYFIFDQSIQNTTLLNEQKLKSSIPNGLRWIGYTLGEITHYTVLAKLLAVIYNKYNKKPWNGYIYIAILIIILNATITTSRQMSGLIMSAILYMQLIRMFPKRRRLLLNLSIVSGLSVITTLIISYLSLSATYRTISSLVESYTNGFYGIYQSLESLTLANLGFFEKYQLLFLGDTLGFINVISTFLSRSGQINSTDVYNYYLYGSGVSGGQIIPMISQGYLYLGLLFSPAISVASVVLMYRYDGKVRQGKGSYMCNMFLAIVFAVAPIMYNYSILLLLLTTVAFPLYIASLLNSINLGRKQ